MVPILDYASGSWCLGPTNCGKVDNVQLHASRYYCGLPRNAATLGVYGEMRWCPGVMRKDLEAMRLYNHIVRMEDNRIARRVLSFDRRNNGLWSRKMGNILSSISCVQNWNDMSPINVDLARKELTRMYCSTWTEETKVKPKLELYSIVSPEFSVSPHLVSNVPKFKRSLISRLLTGSLQLQVEMGRYTGIPRNQCYCQLCNDGKVEDEIHFVFECEAYRSK